MTKRKQIVFVDHDQHLLDSIQRRLRSQRKVWNCAFIADTTDALKYVAEKKPDLIISDLRMPRMDGAHFLHRVKEVSPQSVRMILTGETDQEANIDLLEVANQCLAKPCTVADIENGIIELLEVQELIGEAKVKKKIAGLSSLPSFPRAYLSLKKQLQNPDISVAEVGSTISRDPAITAKIMQFINSPFYNPGGKKVTCPTRAVSLLGLEFVAQVTLISHMFDTADNSQCKTLKLNALWNRSQAVSSLAKLLASSEDFSKEQVELISLSGLMHGIGKLTLATTHPDLYRDYLSQVDATPHPTQLEKRLFGADHPSVGAFLCAVWGLPRHLSRMVAYQRAPQRCPQKELMQPLTVLHCAVSFLEGREPSEIALETSGLHERWPQWQELAKGYKRR